MNSEPDYFANLAWTQLWQVTAVALAVGVIVRLACRRRPHLAYALWMLVIAKALTPPVWSSPAGVFSWAQARRNEVPADMVSGGIAGVPVPPEPIEPVWEPRAPVVSDARAPVLPKPGPRPALSAAAWLVIVWLVGAMGISAVVLAKWLGLCWRLRQSAVLAGEDLQALVAGLTAELGLRRQVRLVLSAEPIGPAAFGWLWPRVLLPAALAAEKPPAALRAILGHELVHLRRRDPVAGKVQLLAQALWWFHPLVWWANREARRERERACDEEVIARLGCRPADYARSLLDILEWRRALRPAFAWPGVRPWEVTSKRLEHIMKSTKRFHARMPRWCWVVLAVSAVVVLPGANLRLQGSSAKTSQRVEPKLSAVAMGQNVEPEARVWVDRLVKQLDAIQSVYCEYLLEENHQYRELPSEPVPDEKGRSTYRQPSYSLSEVVWMWDGRRERFDRKQIEPEKSLSGEFRYHEREFFNGKLLVYQFGEGPLHLRNGDLPLRKHTPFQFFMRFGDRGNHHQVVKGAEKVRFLGAATKHDVPVVVLECEFKPRKLRKGDLRHRERIYLEQNLPFRLRGYDELFDEKLAQTRWIESYDESAGEAGLVFPKEAELAEPSAANSSYRLRTQVVRVNDPIAEKAWRLEPKPGTAIIDTMVEPVKRWIVGKDADEILEQINKPPEDPTAEPEAKAVQGAEQAEQASLREERPTASLPSQAPAPQEKIEYRDEWGVADGERFRLYTARGKGGARLLKEAAPDVTDAQAIVEFHDGNGLLDGMSFRPERLDASLFQTINTVSDHFQLDRRGSLVFRVGYSCPQRGMRDWKERLAPAREQIRAALVEKAKTAMGFAKGYCVERFFEGVSSIPRNDDEKAAASNLRQIGLGIHAYEEWQKHSPPGTIFSHLGQTSKLPPEQRPSWLVDLLPLLEQQMVFNRFHMLRRTNEDLPWNAPQNQEAAKVKMELFLHPGQAVKTNAEGYPVTHFVGVAGVGKDAAELPSGHVLAGFFGYNRQIRLEDVLDGTAQTIMIMEVKDDFGPWAQGGRATVRPIEDFHGGLVVFGDVHTEYLPADTPPEVLRALATIAGGEKLQLVAGEWQLVAPQLPKGK